MLTSIFLAPLIFFASFRTFHWIKNYLLARRFGLPIILIPISFEDLWWIPLRPWFAWVERLPFALGEWYLYTEMGWPTVDGNKSAQKYGQNFVLCAPSCVQIVTAYGPGLEHVMKHHNTWPQPGAQSQIFAFYGQNVTSTNGADWKRHRKITGTAFNEHSMQEVWDEAIRRTKQIDLSQGKDEQSLKDIRTTFEVVAMRVLAAVGFGQEKIMDTITAGHKQTLMQCLGFILDHIMLTAAFNGVMSAPDYMLPRTLKRLKMSMLEFKVYMEELVLGQMQLASRDGSKSRTRSLLAAMVHANEAEKRDESKTGTREYLTESELYGNIFVFNLAGFETTASTMTFAFSYLAADPDVQEWVTEEVDQYYTSSADHDYAAIYPKLVRCLAVMHEALRLASPAPLFVRTPTSVDEVPIITPSGEKKIAVPPGVLVGLYGYGAHLSSRWGPDAHTFKPYRFVTTSEKGDEALQVPDLGMFLPWIGGTRVCPGKKFSQVEAVAIIAELLSQYRIEPLPTAGESKEGARRRLVQTVDDKYFNISAHVRRPEDAGVRFVPRTKA